MFSFLKRETADSGSLLTSRLYDQTDFYSAFISDLSDATREVIIEYPFISPKRTNALYPSFRTSAKRGVVIVVNTRYPSEHEAIYAEQAAQAIAELQDLGAKELFKGGHHRKLAIIDRDILWEGSLNILSQGDSCDIMRRIESGELARQMVGFVGLDKFL